jgi:hypothetical protein
MTYGPLAFKRVGADVGVDTTGVCVMLADAAISVLVVLGVNKLHEMESTNKRTRRMILELFFTASPFYRLRVFQFY